ncbi:UROD/MetE-like protein [Dendrothele bispora CBS 962.96]|uniref:UROD/MetE-like protein n=1 Tax=Dendrothele bispora (strain CBS 962.96) TaxID=1314807 RepID=A0A4S8MX71_DENBC|nr:UROD/MetE-like protein [Dendrothele bispora CBS 962.96]
MNPPLKPPFRAEHVGSLLRPKILYDRRLLCDQGTASVEDLREVEDEAIKQVVKMQQGFGFKGITDGEMRRAQFFDGVFENLEGLEFIPARPLSEFKKYLPHIVLFLKTGVPAYPSWHCNGKIKRRKPFYVEDFKFTKTLVAPEDVKYIKVNMPSPSWIHQRHGSDWTYDLNVYKNDDEYFDDLAIAYREEIRDLYEAGCRNIQLDDPTFTFFCHQPMLDAMREEHGVDPDVLLETYLRAVNIVTQGRPKDLHLSVHMCRGNYRGMPFCDGPYSYIAEKIFPRLDADTIYLEYDDQISTGDFKALRFIPEDRTVVLGLVTTKSNKIETKEELIKQVGEAATAMVTPTRTKEMALNQICISPQCGFAAVWEGNPLTEEDEHKKLGVLAEAAKAIWKD